MRRLANLSNEDQGLINAWFHQLADEVVLADWSDEDLRAKVLEALLMSAEEPRSDHSDLVRRLTIAMFDDLTCHRVKLALLICDGHVQIAGVRCPPTVGTRGDFFWS